MRISTPSSKKLLFLLTIIVIATALLLFREIKRATGIVTKTKTEPLVSADLFIIPFDKHQAIFGNPGAPLTIAEFADLGDKKSRDLHNLLANFVKNHPLEARLLWFDLPKSNWLKNNTLLHQAAWCAIPQGRFWVFVDLLLKNKTNLSEKALSQIATQTNLNIAKWSTCLHSANVQNHLLSDATIAQTLGISSSPALFINNKRINIQEDFDIIQMLNNFISP